jgi:hypothetical protein
MSSLERALERLLHDRALLAAFGAGRHAELGLSPDEVALLSALDPAELAAIAAKIREELRERRHVGCGGLSEAYPRTLAAYRAAHPHDATLDDLLAAFTASPAFADYREVPHAGRGSSLEESFFLFCEALDVGTAEVREAEFLQAVLRALAVNPRPVFSIPDCVKKRTNAYIAASERTPTPVLFAAVVERPAAGGRGDHDQARFVSGPITPFLRDLLLSDEAPTEVAARHGVGEAVLREGVAALEKLGFCLGR